VKIQPQWVVTPGKQTTNSRLCVAREGPLWNNKIRGISEIVEEQSHLQEILCFLDSI
jgi:hypothetical protein